MEQGKGMNGEGQRKRGRGGPGEALFYPKGRQVSPEEMSDVVALLGEGPYRRDLLIEYLHVIQDKHGCLRAGHLQALSSVMSLPMAEVFEVASFYAHFDIVQDGEAAPPPITVRVCDSLSCALAGAEDLLAALPDALGSEVRVVPAPCMGACDRAPVCHAGHREVFEADADKLRQVVEAGEFGPEATDHQDLATYRSAGGYKILEQCRSGALKVEDVIQTLLDAGLRGMGGAGFPTGRKWDLVRKEPGPRYLTVNGDEGEPGTFKDRYYLEREPQRFLEGMLIAAWAVEAETAYIYLRDEYPGIIHALHEEIAALEAAGLAPPGYIQLRRGAGAYICGEESAMIESIEGKRGLPRHRPPYVAQVGLFGRPTLVNNIETLYWVPEILAKGAEWFASQGFGDSKGLRSYSVSGRVKNPGVKLVPAGITAQQLLDEHCGGMADGHSFKGYLPGGASGGILPASMADIPLDFGKLEPHGCLIGSHAVVILSDQDDMKDVALNLMRFFEDESCGQCTPCRVGTEKAVKLMSNGPWNAGLLDELSGAMRDASICGLGQAAPNPLTSVLKFFPEDL